MRVLIVGCGYLGQFLATEMQLESWSVIGTRRSSSGVSELASLGIEPIEFDWLDHNSLVSLPEVDALVVTVSHASQPNVPHENTHALGLERVKAIRPDWFSSPRDGHSNSNTNDSPRLIYVSTTGVFAPKSNGDWVSEQDDVQPQRPGAIAAAAAERWLTQHHSNYVVIRPAGLYGPDRIPNLSSLKAGSELTANPNSYLNLVRIEDVARGIVTVLKSPSKQQLYCLADDSPVLRSEYYEAIAQHCSFPDPVFADLNSSTTADGLQPRSAGNKRVSNQLFKSDYEFEFRFPDFRSGLLPLLNTN